MLRAGAYHLVVTDIHMPGMSGLALLREVKAVTPDIEVILLTGHGTLDSAVDALQMQAYDYIEKPVNADRLVQTVRNALAQQALASELSRTIQQVASLNRDLKRQVRDSIAVEVPRERIATAGVILDYLERTIGSLGQTGAFLKLRAGLERRRPARAPVDVCKLVRKEAAEVLGVFPWIELKLELPEEAVRTEAEPGALEQALRIVLENAVQAMKERGVVHVGARASDGEVLIRVRDEGPGFSSGSMEALEEPLASGDTGTGLGLLIVRRIAADHQGSRVLANSPAGGGQVTVRVRHQVK